MLPNFDRFDDIAMVEGFDYWINCQAQVQVQVRWRSGEAQEGQEGQIPGPELYPIFGF